jgi:hypothetical protein
MKKEQLILCLVSFFCFFILGGFQCYKHSICDERDYQFDKNNQSVLTPVFKYYNIRDTITITNIIPYSLINDLPVVGGPVQLYTAMQGYYIFELTGGSPFNSVFAGNKFNVIPTEGVLNIFSAGYSVETYNVTYRSDSSNNRFLSTLKIIPQFAGKFAIYTNSGSIHSPSARCDSVNYVQLKTTWDVAARNTEILNETGITNGLTYNTLNSSGTFRIPQNEIKIFYFYVQ